MSADENNLNSVTAYFAKSTIERITYLKKMVRLESKTTAVVGAVALAAFVERLEEAARVYVENPSGREEISPTWQTEDTSQYTSLVEMGIGDEIVEDVNYLHEVSGLENRAQTIAAAVDFAIEIITAWQGGSRVYVEHPNGEYKALYIPNWNPPIFQ